MTGARFVYDTLEQEGWAVEIADAEKVKGFAPTACKTDKVDSMVLARLSQLDLVPAIWLPDPRVREERELARFRLHLVKHRSALKNRIHSTLINFGRPCPVTDLFRAEGRRLLDRLDVPEPWRGDVSASLELIDHLERQITAPRSACAKATPTTPTSPVAKRPGDRLGAGLHDRRGDRRDRALRLTREARQLHRPLPKGEPVGRQGPPRALDQTRPRYLRWALEATMHALKHPAYAERYQRNKRRLGKQRGAKVAQIDVARRLATRSGTCSRVARPSLPEAPLFVWRPDRPFGLAPERSTNFRLILRPGGHRDMSVAPHPQPRGDELPTAT